ncbi:MAG: hypothetical protein WBO73_00820 [Gammaproteobacteria bacterium]
MNRYGFRLVLTLIYSGVFSPAILPLGVHASQDLPTFFDLEKDGDGVISPEEAVDWSALTSAWDSVDKNRDNQIDMREWNAFDPKTLSSEQKQKKPDDK